MPENDRHHQSTARDWVYAWFIGATAVAWFVGCVRAVLDQDWTESLATAFLVVELGFAAKRRFSTLMWADETSARREEIMASYLGRWTRVFDPENNPRGMIFTVRWDAWERHYVVNGGPLEGEYLDEAVWVDSLSLRAVIERAEAAGFRPQNNEATRSIRARLDMGRYPYGEEL